ncbi:MAG: hypothetical protein A3K76_01425 [Euryarchaeota archaeon RBG_13_57_23]|nr:MAG: hypothetical protein A3K76_01425 [Euryarchaeota archaeon RBG_13_57_23]
MYSLDVPTEVQGTVDCCIIGAGPAGMTAAVYLARKKLSTAIVSKEIGGQVAWTLGIENYMGYQYITGRELTAKFEEQVKQFPVPIIADEVSGIKSTGEQFTVTTAGGREIVARTVIVATGKKPKELGLPNEKNLIGRGLSYCATCDGPLFANSEVAVIGGGNSAVQAVIEMSHVASKVYSISRSPWRADAIIKEKAENLPNLERRIGFAVDELLGDKLVEGLRVRDKTSGSVETLRVKGIFVEIGLKPNSEFLKGIIDLNEHGEVEVDCACETNVPGIFAAGDVTNVHEKQIVVAAGEGAKAALSAHEYLMRKPGFSSDGPSTW